jgi:hypothetical protein
MYRMKMSGLISFSKRWLPMLILAATALLALNRFSRSLPPATASKELDTKARGINVLINGGYDFWSATPVHNPACYTPLAFNWDAGYNGANIDFTVSKEMHRWGTPYLHWVQHTPAKDQTYNNLEYFLPSARLFSGETATLSFLARMDRPQIISVRIQQFIRPTGVWVPVAPALVEIGTTWKRYSITYAIPEMEITKLAWPHNLALFFELPTNAAFTVDLSDVQLERGDTATPFQRL